MDIEVQTPELNAFINERVRSFSWTGLNIDVGSTTIIDNANGRAKAGQFLAIMGPRYAIARDHEELELTTE